MTRIIAGHYGGRRIETPKGDGTRPTSDRVREAMFSSIQSELGGFESLQVLDLFAGSGALGLETLSRGASHATFVESDARAAAVIKGNIKSLGVSGAAVVKATASGFLEREHDDGFDLVFLDPPYALPTTQLTGLVRRAKEISAAEALFVVERATRDPFEWPEGVEGLRHKKYGETTVWYGR
ncbi:16S rRNA (guanine(966)-N(2))-methyltransferase RsmD [Aeromicrobium sp. 9AM]|uniref:16S rRNA (guanine(966)-N(2))-methyltransferase RsmD n=1 Tax=Aeromicrobium sp. 9AM TaxID=2653126 RepID=UPI0012F068A1|nr:16S rRNA (guanine(966)-N(2))-methyltransferase RsmD [Aeromicrobium sp. 9AM]VXC10300.1 16S rRNA (Guanine(966)-N(2))-methyltransferase RsmD [Aeromicrobium sp. 9AM]